MCSPTDCVRLSSGYHYMACAKAADSAAARRRQAAQRERQGGPDPQPPKVGSGSLFSVRSSGTQVDLDQALALLKSPSQRKGRAELFTAPMFLMWNIGACAERLSKSSIEEVPAPILLHKKPPIVPGSRRSSWIFYCRSAWQDNCRSYVANILMQARRGFCPQTARVSAIIGREPINNPSVIIYSDVAGRARGGRVGGTVYDHSGAVERLVFVIEH